MIGFIYKTTNKINGKSYIGMCSSEKRFSTYLGSGLLLKQAIKKYGKDAFVRTILEECDTDEDLRISEEKWINYYDAVNSPKFYNLMEGGRGGNTGFKDETSMSDIVKNTWDNYTEEEYKQRCSNMGKYDKHGDKNPTSKRAIVNDKEYSCLKDVLKDYPEIPYSSLKYHARTEKYSKKYNIRAKYVK